MKKPNNVVFSTIITIALLDRINFSKFPTRKRKITNPINNHKNVIIETHILHSRTWMVKGIKHGGRAERKERRKQW